MIERTLSLIKPDATQRGLTDDINHAITAAGLAIIAQKELQLSLEEAQEFYAIHKERPFFDELCAFMVSAPIVAQVLEGEDAVAHYRRLMGATNPADAEDGTLRKKFAQSVQENAVHGSDSSDNAAREIKFFFPELAR